MGIDYDAWLEKPYQDMYAAEYEYEQAEESYRDSTNYSENLDEWLEANIGKTEDDYKKSPDYEKDVERYIQYLDDKEEADREADREFFARRDYDW